MILRRRASHACLITVFAFLVLASSASAQTVGFRDQSVTGTGTQVTGAKPESKLWFNDGQWWTSMWDEVQGDNYIYRLNPVTQTWTNTGTEIDNRSGTRADTLWDGTKLYVASHGYTNTAQQSAGGGGRIYRFTYDTVADRYTLDAGFPVKINNWKTETLVLAKDSTGKLWATWNQGTQIYVTRTLTSDATWGTPFTVPAVESGGISTDDISSVIAFGGNKIGVMWSDQTRAIMHFAIHVDGTAAGTWTRETALSGPLSADDHINLKADSTGRVFAATKTSQTNPDAPLAQLLVRSPTGTWTPYVFGRQRDHHTRPIVVLDSTNGVAHMFATSGEEGGTIYHKKAEINNLAFEEGIGTPVLRDAMSADMNDVTSTKQNVTSAMGLVIQGSDDTSRVYWHNTVALGPLPLDADFTGTPTRGAAPLAVSFTDTSRGAPTTWSWDFGDGSTSIARNPTKTYSSAGTYTVKLRVTNAVGAVDELTRTAYITAEPLAASFTGAPTSGAAPLAVNFTNTSTGKPTSWSWDFGDGATSALQNPSHTYSVAGTYSVRLTVTGAGGGTNTLTRLNYVTALPLTADFTGSPTTGPAPLATTFTDTSIGTPTSWSWNFGDGATSALRNPAHTYATPGSYTVTLTVGDAAGGTSTKTRASYVTALPLTAEFTATPTFGAAPLAVTFSDTSIGTPTIWSWDFGDGGTSSLENPSHTYTDAGVYTISLTVTDATGATSTRTRTDYVTASPDVIFTPAGDSYVSSSPPDRNFGGAASIRVRTGDDISPHYVSYMKFEVTGLTAGVTAAKLRLQVTDAALDGGQIYVVDNGWTETGLLWANAPAITGSPLAAVGPAEHGATIEVALPASAFASGNGTYSLAIKSDNPSGGTAWFSSREGVAAPQLALRTIPLPLQADFSGTPRRGGAPLTVSFEDTSQGEPTGWLWDFGDGTTSTAENPTHTYTDLGPYTVSLTVSDARGDVRTKTVANFITVEPLAAGFEGTPTSGPAPLAVAFTDASTGSPVAWAWDFGDGATSPAQSPSHTYSVPGTYTVTLTVTDAGGATSTQTRTDYVQSIPLTADFTATPTFGSAPLDVAFTDRTAGTPTSWAWDFGDGATSTAQNPSHTYANIGVYSVSLTVTEADGDVSTKTRTNYVTASGNPVFSAGADSFASSNEPDRNFGTAGSVRVRSAASSPPEYVSYLKFAVSGLGSGPTSVKLRLYVTDAATEGGRVYVVDNGWTESTLTWNNAPVVGSNALVTLPGAPVGSWIEADLPASAFAAGDGTYSLAIKSNNPNAGAVWYSSREGTAAAQLVVSVG